jgi:hypothetical protein
MRDMGEEKSSGRPTQDILTQGDTLFTEAVKVMGADDQNAQMRRNELLLKIADQTTEVNRKLKDVDILQKQLKKHLENLQQLRKMLGD